MLVPRNYGTWNKKVESYHHVFQLWLYQNVYKSRVGDDVNPEYSSRQPRSRVFLEDNLGTPLGLPGIFSHRTDGDIEGGCSAHKSTQRGILVTVNTEY